MNLKTHLTVVATLACLAAGCDDLPEIAYHADTPAAQMLGTNSFTATIPVVFTDSALGQRLQSTPVQIQKHESGGATNVQVHCEITLRPTRWRVGIWKDNAEIAVQHAEGQPYGYGQAISLNVLALDPSLPTPDRVTIQVE